MRPTREDGVLSLELALAVPVLFLLLLVVFHALVLCRDVLIAHDAARAGARVAATTVDHGDVVAAVAAAADGHDVQVSVVPRSRHEGELVRVEVTMRSTAGLRARTVRATAVAYVEPGVGG